MIRDDGSVEYSKFKNEEGIVFRYEKMNDGINCSTLYNEHGYVIYEESPEYDDNNTVYIAKYSGYVYDSHGNWIKRVKSIIVEGKEIPSTITVRTILFSAMGHPF